MEQPKGEVDAQHAQHLQQLQDGLKQEKEAAVAILRVIKQAKNISDPSVTVQECLAQTWPTAQGPEAALPPQPAIASTDGVKKDEAAMDVGSDVDAGRKDQSKVRRPETPKEEQPALKLSIYEEVA